MDEATKFKKDEEVLAEIYRNCQLALQSISNVLPETKDEELRKEIEMQHEYYEKISSKIKKYNSCDYNTCCYFGCMLWCHRRCRCYDITEVFKIRKYHFLG